MWEEVVTDTQMSASSAGISVWLDCSIALDKWCGISDTLISGEVTWWYRSYKLVVTCLMTLRRASPETQIFSECERTASHYFLMFMSGDLSLCDEPRNGRPQALEDKFLKLHIEQQPNLRWAWRTFPSHLHTTRKAYKLIKWVAHALRKVNQQQQLTASLSLLSRQRSIYLFHLVLTCDDKAFLYDNLSMLNFRCPHKTLCLTPQ